MVTLGGGTVRGGRGEERKFIMESVAHYLGEKEAVTAVKNEGVKD